MSRLRIPSQHLRSGAFELSEDATHYALRVHRLQVGDELELFDAKTGELARASIESIPKGRDRHLTVLIEQVMQCSEDETSVSLLCCLGKGDKPEQALRDATALGVSNVVLVVSERVQAPRAHRDQDRYEKVMIETARQSGRNRIPTVTGPVRLSDAVGEARGLRLACVPGEQSAPLLVALRDWVIHEPITVLLGPEGGLNSSELECIKAENFRSCSLGPFVLRAERAVPVALGIIQAFHAARR